MTRGSPVVVVVDLLLLLLLLVVLLRASEEEGERGELTGSGVCRGCSRRRRRDNLVQRHRVGCKGVCMEGRRSRRDQNRGGERNTAGGRGELLLLI